MHNQKEDNNQSKINKQPEAPENQTAWNSDNQGIKEKNQPEQPDQWGSGLYKLAQRNQGEAADQAVGLRGRGWLKGKLRLRVDMAVATVGETPSLTWESLGKCAGEEQVICFVPFLAPPPQAVQLKIIWDNLKRSNIQIIGVPEGEEQQQEIENLFEQIMGNFPNLMKEIDF